MKTLKTILSTIGLIGVLAAPTLKAEALSRGTIPLVSLNGKDTVFACDSSQDGYGRAYCYFNGNPYVVRGPQTFYDTITYEPTGEMDTIVTPQHDVISIDHVPSNTGAGVLARNLGKDLSKTPDPVANIIFTSSGKDTLIDGYNHNYVFDVDSQALTLEVEKEKRIMKNNIPVLFSTNGKTYIYISEYVGGIGTRGLFSTSDNTNYSLGDTRKLTAKGVIKDVVETAYDNVTKNVLLTSGTKKAVGKQGDTVNVDGLEVLISKVNTDGTLELQGIDTATIAQPKNYFSLNDITQQYITPNGDTVKVTDIIGDTVVIDFSNKIQGLQKSSAASQTYKIKAGESKEFSDGTIIKIYNVFEGKDKTGANVVYIDASYDKSTGAKQRPNQIMASPKLNNGGRTAIYDVSGRLVSHENNFNKASAGMYLVKNQDGKTNKIQIRR